MKNFMNDMIDRIPWITLVYFINILIAATVNIVQHNDPTGFCLFAVELACCCIGIYVVNYLVNLIPFKHNIAFHITNALACYTFFMGCGYFFHFFGFRLSNIIRVTIIFIILYIILTAFINYDYKRKSKQINDLIQKKQP